MLQRTMDAAVMSDSPRAVGDSFDRIFQERQVQVLRTAYRITGNWADAEDVAQQVFVRLHRHGVNFANDAALNSWLYRVTANLCVDQFRSAKPTSPIFDLASPNGSAEAAVIQGEEKERLLAALAMLPTKERAAIVLREIEGLSTAEVAEALGSTAGTVRSQIAKATSRLQAILSEGGK